MKWIKYGTSITTIACLLSLNVKAGSLQSDLESRTGMQSIQDSALQAITAQGINEDSQYLIDLAEGSGPDDEGGLKSIMVLLQTGLPVLNFFGDYEITGVTYADPSAPPSTVNDDGSVSLLLPDNIDEIAYRNIKFDSASSVTLGDLTFRNISSLPDSTVTLIPRPPEP